MGIFCWFALDMISFILADIYEVSATFFITFAIV